MLFCSLTRLSGITCRIPSQLRHRVLPAVSNVRNFAAEAVNTGKLKLTLASPYETFFKNQDVDMVIAPGVDGNFTIIQKHIPIIAELKPGVLTVKKKGNSGEDQVTKLFITGGFAVVGKDSFCRISTVEAVPVNLLDSEAIRDGYNKANQALSSAPTDYAKAVARIGVQTYISMAQAAGFQL